MCCPHVPYHGQPHSRLFFRPPLFPPPGAAHAFAPHRNKPTPDIDADSAAAAAAKAAAAAASATAAVALRLFSCSPAPARLSPSLLTAPLLSLPPSACRGSIQAPTTRPAWLKVPTFILFRSAIPPRTDNETFVLPFYQTCFLCHVYILSPVPVYMVAPPCKQTVWLWLVLNLNRR